jgi:hypothetical protein
LPLPMPSVLCRAKTKQVHCACCKPILSLSFSHTDKHTHTLSLFFLTLSPSPPNSSLTLSFSQREIGPQWVLRFSPCLFYLTCSLSICFSLSLSRCLTHTLSDYLYHSHSSERRLLQVGARRWRHLAASPESEIYFFPLSNIFESTFSEDAIHWPLSRRKCTDCSDSIVTRKQPTEAAVP